MQDTSPGWVRYIEDLEEQAACLRRRRGQEPAAPGIAARLRALLVRLAAALPRFRNPEIGG